MVGRVDGGMLLQRQWQKVWLLNENCYSSERKSHFPLPFRAAPGSMKGGNLGKEAVSMGRQTSNNFGLLGCPL